MIGGLQLLARTQSSRYVINEASWVCNDAFQVAFAWIFLDKENLILLTFQLNRMEMADFDRRTLEDRIINLELENRQNDPRFYASQEGNTEGSSSRHRQT